MSAPARAPLILLLCTFSASVCPAQQPTQRQPAQKAGMHALIVANAKYDNLASAPVAHSISDAHAIQAALSRVGFDIQFEQDVPDVPSMIEIERKFLKALVPGDKALFYFSGYGFQSKGENYLVPTRYKHKPEAESYEEAYQVTRLQQKLDEKKLEFAILVLDACREENALRAQSDREGLTNPSDKTKATLIVLPTYPGEFIAKEPPGQQLGAFASAFVAALVEPGLNIPDFIERIRKTVSQATKSEQVPTVVLNNITTDFYFVAPVVKVEEAKTIINEQDRLTYVKIPGGHFTMGCAVKVDHECTTDEMPPHEVTISRRFWIGSTEVTVKAYQEFLQGPKVKGHMERKVKMPGAPLWNKGWRYTDRPIVSVPWETAEAYCKWVGGRLPTEAEWEYAARGGREGTIYPWGNTFDPKWAATKVDTPQPADTYPANSYGLYDMIGNVWEWTQDVYDAEYYQKSIGAKDPKGPGSGGGHVKRGGSYLSPPKDLRTSMRKSLTGADNITGFRCVLEEVPTEGKTGTQ